MCIKHELSGWHVGIPQYMLDYELLKGTTTLLPLWDLASSRYLANAPGMDSPLTPWAFLTSLWRSQLCLSALPPGPKPSLCRAEPH